MRGRGRDDARATNKVEVLSGAQSPGWRAGGTWTPPSSTTTDSTCQSPHRRCQCGQARAPRPWPSRQSTRRGRRRRGGGETPRACAAAPAGKLREASRKARGNARPLERAQRRRAVLERRGGGGGGGGCGGDAPADISAASRLHLGCISAASPTASCRAAAGSQSPSSRARLRPSRAGRAHPPLLPRGGPLPSAPLGPRGAGIAPPAGRPPRAAGRE